MSVRVVYITCKDTWDRQNRCGHLPCVYVQPMCVMRFFYSLFPFVASGMESFAFMKCYIIRVESGREGGCSERSHAVRLY